jgi:hypothetical protein
MVTSPLSDPFARIPSFLRTCFGRMSAAVHFIGYGCRPGKCVATSGRSPSGLREEELAADPHGIGNRGCEPQQPSNILVLSMGTVGATQATTVNVPVETPAPTAQASIEVTVVPISVAPTTEVPPKPAAIAGTAPAALTTPYAVRVAPIASAELGTVRGVTIVDNSGALERKGPPPAPESLGDAARRLRQSKQR